MSNLDQVERKLKIGQKCCLECTLRWGDKHELHTELIHVSPGEVAGIKSATIHFEGELCLWLATNRNWRPSTC